MTKFLQDRPLLLTARVACLAAMLVLAGALPASAAEGEFDDQCTMGLASGQIVKTDCAVNWTDEDGHIYCFSSESS